MRDTGPVLTDGRTTDLTWKMESLMKILLPVDGSEFTSRMLGFIADQHELLGPRHSYTLCTVVAPISNRAASFLDSDSVDAYYRDEAADVLQPLQDFIVRPGWTVRAMHVVGSPAQEIAELAVKQHYELIIMGTHGHSVFSSVVMGSVTTGVIARCKTPVLLVR